MNGSMLAFECMLCVCIETTMCVRTQRSNYEINFTDGSNFYYFFLNSWVFLFNYIVIEMIIECEHINLLLHFSVKLNKRNIVWDRGF